MVYVYAIKSLKDNRIYVGQTNNLDKRVNEHNAGATKTTKPFRPWHLFYKEKFPDRKTAREKEKYFKAIPYLYYSLQIIDSYYRA